MKRFPVQTIYLASELVGKKSFFKPITIEEIVIFIISAVMHILDKLFKIWEVSGSIL